MPPVRRRRPRAANSRQVSERPAHSRIGNGNPRLAGVSRVERAGLEPATPSLQILLRGGHQGSVLVGAKEARRLRECGGRRWAGFVGVI